MNTKTTIKFGPFIFTNIGTPYFRILSAGVGKAKASLCYGGMASAPAAGLTLVYGNHATYFEASIPRPLQRIYNRFAWRVTEGARMIAAMYWPPGPVYVYRHSCDCDLTHGYWVAEYPSKYAALRAYYDACEWAEGQEHMEFITEAEFLEFGERQTWDQAAEMMGY